MAAGIGLAVGLLTIALSREARENAWLVLGGTTIAGPLFVVAGLAVVVWLFRNTS